MFDLTMVDGGELVSRQAYCIFEKPDWNDFDRKGNEERWVKDSKATTLRFSTKEFLSEDSHHHGSSFDVNTNHDTDIHFNLRALVPILRSKVS